MFSHQGYKMTAKEGLKTKEYIELQMSDDKRSNVKGDSKVETEVTFTADTAKTHEQIIPPFCRICFDESSSPQAPVPGPSSKPGGSPTPTDNPLLRPCLCSGTTAAVHLICLRRWQAISKSDNCELCHAQFNIPKELCMRQDVSPSESLSVNHPHPMSARKCFRKLVVLILLLGLQFIPIVIVVLIMTIQVEEQLQTTSTTEFSSMGLGMFGRAILSISVCVLYIPLLYVCLFKSRWLFTLFKSQDGRRTRRYSSMPRERSHNPNIWHRQLEERNHYFLETAIF